ncbi:MAG TPA: hypothetical protein VFU37_21815 [Pyrinomonadaceae bacterium]|nr:hypothetical protein [Pyrinomonadaceae bacterium]
MDKPDQAAQQPVDDDYKAKYDALFLACKRANGKKKRLLTTISKDIGALLKIICEPTPPGCSGEIPTDNLEDLLVQVQQLNATKQEKLLAIDSEVNQLMAEVCDPNPPGCEA